MHPGTCSPRSECAGAAVKAGGGGADLGAEPHGDCSFSSIYIVCFKDVRSQVVHLGDFSFHTARVLSMHACRTGRLGLRPVCVHTAFVRLDLRWTEIAPKRRVGKGQATQSTCQQDYGTMRKCCRMKERNPSKDSEKEQVSVSFTSCIRRMFLRNFDLSRKDTKKLCI